MTPLCQQEVGAITLLALRDNTLPPAEADRLRAHLQNCVACSSRLNAIADDARLLRGQPMPHELRSLQMEDRLWRDLRQHIVHSRERIYPSMHVSRATVLRSLGAMVAIAVVAVLVVQGARWLDARRLALITSSASTQTLQIQTDNAITINLPPNFLQTYISPDGNTIIGETNQLPTSDSLSAIGRYTVGTRKLEQLTAFMKIAGTGPNSDGRYVAWVRGDSQNTTVAQTEQLEVLDLQTMQIRTIATKTAVFSTYDATFTSQVDHGMLVWEQSSDTTSTNQVGSLEVTNLATGSTEKLQASFLMGSAIVSWPYILFAGLDTHGNIIEQIANITTGKINQLPKSPATDVESNQPIGSPPGLYSGVWYQIQGTTVFASWVTKSYTFDLAELDHADTAMSGDDWKIVTTITQSSTFKGIAEASYFVNDRLVIFQGENPSKTTYSGSFNGGSSSATVWMAWDRDLHQLIQFSPSLVGNDGWVSTFGSWLVVSQVASSNFSNVHPGTPTGFNSPVGLTLLLIDTNSLHVKHG